MIQYVGYVRTITDISYHSGRTGKYPQLLWEAKAEEAIEQGRLSELIFTESGTCCSLAAFHKAELHQRIQHPPMESGPDQSWEGNYLRSRNGTKSNQPVPRVPVARGACQRPQYNADMRLWPGGMRRAVEISEIQAPERRVEKGREKGRTVMVEQGFAVLRHDQLAPKFSQQPSFLRGKSQKMQRRKIGLVDDLGHLECHRDTVVLPFQRVAQVRDDGPCEIAGGGQFEAGRCGCKPHQPHDVCRHP